MKSFYHVGTLILCAFFVSIHGSAWCQKQEVIFTKRDVPIGLVTFAPAVISGVLGDQVFIDGYIKKKGTDSFIFPVGDNGSYRPFAAAADQTYGAYYQSDPALAVTSDPLGGNYGVLPQGGPFPTTNLDKTLAAVSHIEYWDINGSAPTTITLSWNEQSDVNTLTSGFGLTKLTIAGWDGNKWVKIPSKLDVASILGDNSTLTSGSITTELSIIPDNFNVYTLAADASGALPVTLVSFKAIASEQTAYLQWTTSEELNSSHFNVERSPDTKSWISIGQVRSKKGTPAGENGSYDFHDQNPINGHNYYRLKMVDLDSSFAYSHIAHVDFDVDLTLDVYPNPVRERIYFKGAAKDDLHSVSLLSSQGAVISIQDDLKEGFAISQLSSGMYILNLAFKNGTTSSRKIFILQ